MPPGYVILSNIYNIYKGNNTNNRSTSPNNALNCMEGNNHSCIFQIIIKCTIAQTLANGIKPFKIDKNIFDMHDTYT